MDGSLRDSGEESIHRRIKRHPSVSSQRAIDEHQRGLAHGGHPQHQSWSRQTQSQTGKRLND